MQVGAFRYLWSHCELENEAFGFRSLHTLHSGSCSCGSQAMRIGARTNRCFHREGAYAARGFSVLHFVHSHMDEVLLHFRCVPGSKTFSKKSINHSSRFSLAYGFVVNFLTHVVLCNVLHHQLLSLIKQFLAYFLSMSSGSHRANSLPGIRRCCISR